MFVRGVAVLVSFALSFFTDFDVGSGIRRYPFFEESMAHKFPKASEFIRSRLSSEFFISGCCSLVSAIARGVEIVPRVNESLCYVEFAQALHIKNVMLLRPRLESLVEQNPEVALVAVAPAPFIHTCQKFIDCPLNCDAFRGKCLFLHLRRFCAAPGQPLFGFLYRLGPLHRLECAITDAPRLVLQATIR